MMRTPSLFRHLVAWTLGALFIVWTAFMYFGYQTGIHEADELTDGHLASVATVLFTNPLPAARSGAVSAPAGSPSDLRAHDYQQSLSIFIWDASGKVLSRTGEAPEPPFTPDEGFDTVLLGKPPLQWRTFSRWDGPAHVRKVTVMLSVRERDDLAEDIADQVATPGLWLLPVVALVLVFAIRRGLRPLRDLSEQVNRLDVHQAAKLQAPPHEEFRAIVNSIETLVGRYNLALDRERELASEVAHELRTPLASLRLHAAALRQGLAPGELEAAHAQILSDSERAAAVLTDLLALARAGRAELAEAQEAVDLAALARRVAGEFGQAALESGHDLSVEGDGTSEVRGHRVIIELAVRNLIENALAHTPAGTAVRVCVTGSPPALEVIDDAAGPAAPGQAGPRKHLGLGLGLQVVRRVAQIHGGTFEASGAPAGDGSCYRLEFPRG
ncbi:MAG: histidine kinase dimerization/phospho-acceptor domain-containing protein [Burkholderiaceae bacterium]